jgi:hypothetical protein
MPAEHTIDANKKLILTTWSGEVADGELIKALSAYQLTIKNRPEYASFDEIVDFSKGTHYHLSMSGLQRLVEIATVADARGAKTKLAIVVTTPVAYTLARMYQVYRSFIPGASKILRIFRTYDEARHWVENSTLKIKREEVGSRK